MVVAVVIVAAGRGRRMGAQTPKQYLPIGDTCALRLSVERFLAVEDVQHVVTVIHPDDRALYDDALGGLDSDRVLEPVPGGATRGLSVRAGLEALELLTPSAVLIHDAARPFVPVALIERMIELLQHEQGVCAALPVVDALWAAQGDVAKHSVPRDGVWRAQTPQGFRFSDILAAHRADRGDGADDVAVAVAAGMTVRFVEGSDRNYKITTAADWTRAEADASRNARTHGDRS